MKKITTVALLASLTTSAYAIDLKTEDSKISYSIGVQMGESLASLKDTIKIDRAATIEAINHILDGKASQLSEKEMDEVMSALQKRVMASAQKKYQEGIAKNTEASKQLLANNKAKEGVKVTPSGLQYRVIKAGKGDKPTAKDTVKVHYKGTLPNGKVFDSSYDRGEPVSFPLNAVIKGWTEGLQLMPVGSTYEFVIPANLAYGDKAPASIGPAQALTFQVELLDIKKVNKTTEKKK